MATKPLFHPGDIITNGDVYATITHTTRSHYKLQGFRPEYLPITLVDKYWRLADDVEIED